MDRPDSAITRVKEQLDEAGQYRLNILAIRATHMSRIFAYLQEREAENERLRDALGQIEQWIAAYPEVIFHPLTTDEMQQAAHVLREAGISMDAMHAGWARQILDGLRDIARHAKQEA